MTPLRRLRLIDTCRLIPSRYPPTGILNRIAAPADLDALFELENWTNDRISNELGILSRIPEEEWVVGRPMSTVIMAAFCHPSPDGGRFNGPERGAWYAGRTLETAQAESIYRRTTELTEVGVFEARVQMRLYLADFQAAFHDVRAKTPDNEPYHDPRSYTHSQALARDLFADGSNGIVYRSVRKPGGQCVACFRPPLVNNVRQGAHFEYRWEGTPAPRVVSLRAKRSS